MWLYKNKVIENISDLEIVPFGFIYITTHIPTGKRYLGKKSFFHTTNQKLGKKELESLPPQRGRKPTTKKVIKESDWKSYYGSEEFIKKEIKLKKHQDFHREIIQLVFNKKLLTYYELKYQFEYGVIEPNTGSNWLNNNLLGKFYTRDFE
jgi:hypothetical protein